MIVSPGWTTKHSNCLFIQVGSVRLCFFPLGFSFMKTWHWVWQKWYQHWVKRGKVEGRLGLGIHETKQENRDSDNDLFLCHCEGKKFDEWGLFNFRCCLKPVASTVWDDGMLYHISISGVLIIVTLRARGLFSLSYRWRFMWFFVPCWK